MSNQMPNDDNNLLSFIAANVETMRDEMTTIRDQMTTKSDLDSVRDRMATKSDLDSLRGNVDSLREEVSYIGGQVETVRQQMATKSDLARLESKLEVETTVVRGDIEQVHLRLDSIERALSTRLGQIETEVSRLRSVVYLLVKDQPEMLRLLGQSS